MPSWLVPPLRGRPGVSRLIRSVPCSMRFTGRPRPVPGGGSTRCTTRSSAVMSCSAHGLWCAGMAQVEEYWVTRLLDELASELRERRYHPMPARRVLISKPRTDEMRPLSIPAVRDRIVQAALKIVLEPVFEASFLPCSFGFRPRLSALRLG